MPEPSALELKMAIEKLIWYGSPDINQIPTEFIQAGSKKVCSEIHKLINSVKWVNKILFRIRKNCLYEWKESIAVPIYKEGDKRLVLIQTYHCYQIHTKFYLPSCCSHSICTWNYCELSVWILTYKIYHCTCQILAKNWNTLHQNICGKTSRMPMNQSRGRLCITPPLSLVSIWIVGS